jgi:hypothetical protein
MRYGVLVLAVCLALAGCGGTGDTAGRGGSRSSEGSGAAGSQGGTGADPSSSASLTPGAPRSFTASGFLTAEGTFAVACSGIGSSSGLRRGAPVVVRNANGTVVATGALEDGFADDDAPQRRCIFPFTVRRVPEEGGPFTVRVAGRPAGGFDRRQAAQVGLHIG